MSSPLAHVRPLGFGEVLDGAFTLYRRYFGIFFSTALLPQIPGLVLWAGYLAVLAVARPSPEAQGSLFDMVRMISWPLWLGATLLPWAALTRLAGDAYLGNEVSRANGFRWAWRRSGKLLLAALLIVPVVALGLLYLVVPGVMAMGAAFAVVPVVVLEQRGVRQAMNRSWGLASGAWGRVIGVLSVLLLMHGLATAGISFLINLGLSSVAPGITAPTVWPAVSGVLDAFTSAMVMPVTVAGITLLYFDRRVRAEAFGLDPQGTLPSAFA